MEDVVHIIKPERVGLWTAAAMIVALLALGTALVGIMRYHELAVASQTQVLMLNKKIEDMKGGTMAMPAMPASPMKEAK